MKQNGSLLGTRQQVRLRAQIPAYRLRSGALLKIAPATLRSWVPARPHPKARGTGHFHPSRKLAKKDPATLSFWHLIQAHVLRSLRTEHVVVAARDAKGARVRQRDA